MKLTHDDLWRGNAVWPEKSGSQKRVEVENLLQFLGPEERIHFVNELCRVMKKGATAQVSFPHYATTKAYGDLSYQWPPVTESWLFHLRKDWRKDNAPWSDKYTCDFDATWGYAMHPSIVSRNPEYQQQAIQFWREAAQDVVATLTRR